MRAVAVTITRDMPIEKLELKTGAQIKCGRSGNDVRYVLRATIGAHCDNTLGPAPSPYWVTRFPFQVVFGFFLLSKNDLTVSRSLTQSTAARPACYVCE
jgi:hypothetical protein